MQCIISFHLLPIQNKFWVLCSALKEFIKERNDLLPVKGVVPDMTADSEKYISLQNVYVISILYNFHLFFVWQ